MEISVPLNTCSRVPVVLYLTSTLHEMEAMTHRQDPSTIKGLGVNRAPAGIYVRFNQMIVLLGVFLSIITAVQDLNYHLLNGQTNI